MVSSLLLGYCDGEEGYLYDVPGSKTRVRALLEPIKMPGELGLCQKAMKVLALTRFPRSSPDIPRGYRKCTPMRRNRSVSADNHYDQSAMEAPELHPFPRARFW